MKLRSRLEVFFWSSLILIISQAVTLYIASREKVFLEDNQIVSPQLPLGLPVVYFLAVAGLMGIVLSLVPIAKLRLVLRVLFAFLYSWGVFIVLALSLPVPVAGLISIAVISIAGGLMWLFRPTIWLHNLLMVLTMGAIGSVFGFLFSPWTFMMFMLVISIYDILAVRFGYMLWLAKKLSESDTLPAFLIPRTMANWKLNLRDARLKKWIEDEQDEREFSVLGGGDVGFPLMLTVAVFFGYGFTMSLVVAVCSLAGLIGAYWIQSFFLKGKPMPAMPPISFACLIGLIIVHFI